MQSYTDIERLDLMLNQRLVFIVFLVLLTLTPNTIRHGTVFEIHLIPDKMLIAESLTPHDIIWINGDEMFHEQAELEDWPGNGTEEDPYLISGYYFNTWNKPLTIYHSSLYWVFTNNLIDGEDDHGGTWIQNCSHGAIVNNEICNRRFAIAIASGSGINISGNYIHDCWENGIEFMAGMNNATVQNNIIENIGVAGFYSGLSRNSIIANNTITNCGNYGVALLGVISNCTITSNVISYTGNETIEGVGMRLMIFDTSEVSFNEITNCTSYGILIDTGNISLICWNIITNSSKYAVTLLPESNLIQVRFNAFLDNGFDCQVLDNGTLNEFSHNYYSDWNTPDGNSDGYVDTPYQIEGAAGNLDRYPLVKVGVIPPEIAGTSVGDIAIAILLVGLVIVIGTLYLRRRDFNAL